MSLETKKRLRKLALLLSIVVFIISISIFFYGVTSAMSVEDKANLLSISSVLFIANIILSAILLHAVQGKDGD